MSIQDYIAAKKRSFQSTQQALKYPKTHSELQRRTQELTAETNKISKEREKIRNYESARLDNKKVKEDIMNMQQAPRRELKQKISKKLKTLSNIGKRQTVLGKGTAKLTFNKKKLL